MKKSHIATLIVFFVLIPLTLIVGSRLSGRAFYVTSTLVIVELLIPFFLAFEGRRPQARELVVLAVMCALAVAGRVAIPIPSFKAIFGIIMIAGIAFGPESGFLVGAISALASNFFYSQGPYTPWQMMAYGAGGMLAGFVFAEGRLPRKPVVMGIFGFLAVAFFVVALLPTCSVFLVKNVSLFGILKEIPLSMQVFVPMVMGKIVHLPNLFLAIRREVFALLWENTKSVFGLTANGESMFIINCMVWNPLMIMLSNVLSYYILILLCLRQRFILHIFH